MNFTWNETKRKTNLKKHGLDFSDVEKVFSGYSLTRPDSRFAYTEKSRTPWTKKTTLPTTDDLGEAPIWTEDDFKNAVHRAGLKPLSQKKQKINIALDPDVVEWFKQQAGGRGYQTLINATLWEAMQKKTIGETIRQVIREKLRSSWEGGEYCVNFLWRIES